ncbi:hypothetical protein HMPREF1403_01689 [Helicobacter pylori GAM201Ai]|nr:hypothetical protein HMPREF1403_01689 [Helicobacter pylori GAM201Ai]
MTQAVIASCFKPPIPLKRLNESLTNYPLPFLGIKFRVKTPLTLFYFLNILVFPAF